MLIYAPLDPVPVKPVCCPSPHPTRYMDQLGVQEARRGPWNEMMGQLETLAAAVVRRERAVCPVFPAPSDVTGHQDLQSRPMWA